MPRYARFMAHKDARSLSSEAQEDLRRRVIEAVQTQGMKKAHAARTFGVSRQAINNWLAAHQRGGDAALGAKPRGCRLPDPHPPGTHAWTPIWEKTDDDGTVVDVFATYGR
ncbi:hypothetical protein EBR04_01875 [bacterium]|nr:hypothetical protein [bacterium]